MKSSSLPFTPGIRHMLLSTFSFAIMNVLTKKVNNLPVMEVVFFRCFTSMLMCFYIIRQQQLDWKGNNRLLLLTRGIFGTLAVITFFITLQKIPLGTAVTIQYLSPIFTTILAIFLLKEKVKALQWIFFIISFAGVIIIKGFDSRISLTMLGIGIFSAFASGVAYNMVRSLKEKEPTMVVVLHFQLVGAFVGLVFTLFNWQTPTPVEWFYLIMIGVCTQVGQTNLTKALNSEKIANVSIFNYLGILYALFFGFAFFGEHYEGLTFVGIVLVVGGVLMNYFYQRSQNNIIAEQEIIEE